MAKSRGINKRHDWDALKAEFICGFESLAAFAARKGITSYMVYAKADDAGWVQARQEVKEKAMDEAKSHAVTVVAERWKKQLSLWEAVEAHAAQLLRKGVQDGKIVMPMEPGELAQLTSALDRALKSQRLIWGESTENVVTKNLHVEMVKMLEDQKGGESNG